MKIQYTVLIACVGMLLVGAGIFVVQRARAVHPEVTPVQVAEEIKVIKQIGTSVQGRAIERYVFGTGDTRVLFVGGMHGGYEWNSVLLAYAYIDYLTEHPESIPDTMSVVVIPDLNPDGVFLVTGKVGRFSEDDVPKDAALLSLGRFNANAVDLNRNFDCKWQPTGTWRSKIVSAGTKAFSEPESAALRDFVLEFSPRVAVFWHSKSNAVYASSCKDGVLPATIAAMETYAKAAKYSAIESFDAYPVSGDAEGWLASIGIPAITVELQTHESIEWERNLAGIDALLTLFGPQ